MLAVQPDSALKITGSLLGVAILVTPPGPGQDVPLDAVVDPATARTATNGVIVLETSNGTLRVHPSAVVNRFPGAGSRFAIVDIATLQPALDLLQPGAGTANELWLASDSAAHERSLASQLSGPGFDSIEVDRRTARQDALATDPLAVVTLLILTAAALVAVVLGACAVSFGAAADSNDDRPLLRMLALERVEGRRLVAMVAGKSLAAICLAIPLGLIGGRWLLQIATRLVAVSATSGATEPAIATGRSVGAGDLVVDHAAGRSRVGCGCRSDVGSPSSRRRPHAGHDVTAPVPVGDAVIDIEDAFVLHRGRTHDVAALRGLSLRVDPGERIVVRGPSGSGKSTLVAAVTAQVRASAGRVRLFGHDMSQLDHAAATRLRTVHVGVVSQRSGLDLIDDLDCLDNVATQARLAGYSRHAGRRAAAEALDRLGLEHLAHRRPASLSGGERQRVALAAALAHGPGLLIADEPTGELDASSADEVYDFLREHCELTGAALLVVTHDERAERVATRVVTIHDGRLSQEDARRSQLTGRRRAWVGPPAGCTSRR